MVQSWVMSDVFDDEDFFEGYMRLRTEHKGNNYNDLLEQPAMRSLLPPLEGLRFLDLGCGCGGNCLEAVHAGASRVLGVDVSFKMLEVGAAELEGTIAELWQLPIEDIDMIEEEFDVIYSSLAFHYIKDYRKLCREVYNHLSEGGVFLFSQEHPLTTATYDGLGDFNRDEKGNAVSYTFSDYMREGKRVVHWMVDGIVKYHRPFSSLVNGLLDAGFVIDTVLEPLPSKEAIRKFPDMEKDWVKPTFMIFKAHKG